MYNRYIRNDAGQYERIPEESPFDAPSPDEGSQPNGEPHGPPPGGGPGGSQPHPGNRGRKGFLSGILERLNLKDLDTGDLILLLIIFLLYKDGEDEELLIALGLLLIL